MHQALRAGTGGRVPPALGEGFTTERRMRGAFTRRVMRMMRNAFKLEKPLSMPGRRVASGGGHVPQTSEEKASRERSRNLKGNPGKVHVG